MEIIGHGVDLIEVCRVEELLRRDDDFLYGWFTSREIDELGPRAGLPEVVGGRVAAKEAVAKALGTGFTDAVSWQDIEILTNESGAPTVLLSGGAHDIAKRLGVARIVVSVSHGITTAIASVIAVGHPPMPSLV
jgi:holo-[acyl-carrier protein] synthase